MSPGKAASQAVHAAMLLRDGFGGSFTQSYRRTVVVLEAEDAQQIMNLSEYLGTAGLSSQYYIDEGANEVAAYSITALAVEPFESKNKRLREIFEKFKLYSYDNYDEDDCDCGPERGQCVDLMPVRRMLSQVLTDTAELKSAARPKPKWYKTLFKRKPKGYVS